MPKPKNTAYLYRHGNQWIVRVKVPDRLRHVLGLSKLVVPLHTDSLAIANRDKHRHIHTLKQRIAEAEIELRRKDALAGRGTARINPLVAEGLEWRAAFEAEASQGDGGPDAPDYVITALDARIDELEASQGEASASIVSRIATGAMPIASLADDWLTVKPLKPRQKLDYRRAVERLEVWLLAKSLSPTVAAITRRIASDYRDEAFVRAGVHPRTANKALSILSGLWKHAERKGAVAEGTVNPWRGQFLPEASAVHRASASASNSTATSNVSAHKRPFADTEVAALLTSEDTTTHGKLLKDAMTLLALSGMRVEELARLKVGDALKESGKVRYIALRGTKTAAARRDVPIHPDALPIILRRSRGKAVGDYAFDELPTPRPTQLASEVNRSRGRSDGSASASELTSGRMGPGRRTWTYTRFAAGSSRKPETRSTAAREISPCSPLRRSWGMPRASWGCP